MSDKEWQDFDDKHGSNMGGSREPLYSKPVRKRKKKKPVKEAKK